MRAAAILQKRAFAEKKIEFAWQSTLAGITGKDFVTGVKVADVPSGVIRDIEAEGVFIFVGLTPNTAVFRDVLSLDKGGYIITDDNMKTSAAGVFAAGDCRAKPFRQVVTAAGDGANAIHSAELYVDALKGRTY